MEVESKIGEGTSLKSLQRMYAIQRIRQSPRMGKIGVETRQDGCLSGGL